MKKAKRILALALALTMTLITLVVAPKTEVQAATKVKTPNAVRCGVGLRNATTFQVQLTSKTDKITKYAVYENGKVTNKVKYKVVTSCSDSNNNTFYKIIQVYSQKSGKFTMKLTIKTKAGTTTRKIVIWAYKNGNAIIKSVTLDGTQVNSENNTSYFYTSKSGGKIKFTLAPGCHIEKIEMIKLDQNGDQMTTKFTNGKKVSLSTRGSSYLNTSDGYTYSSKSFYAYTEFKITYTDSYALDASTERVTYFDFYRLATEWP